MIKSSGKRQERNAVSQTAVLRFKKRNVWIVIIRTIGGLDKSGKAFLFSKNEFVLHYDLKKPRIPGNGAGMKMLNRPNGSPRLFRSFKAAHDFAVKHFSKCYG